MPRFRHAAACAALLAACSCAGIAFVALPRAASPDGQQRLRANMESTVLQPKRSAEVPLVNQSTEGHKWSSMSWIGAGLLAGIVLAVSSTPPAVAADPGYPNGGFTIKAARHLEKCKDNKKFHKRYKDQRYKKEKRQKSYAVGSAIYNRYVDKLASINKREEVYGERYCGKMDGLPRVIATGERGIKGGVITPALMFLYTAGWIGWAGRSYLIRTRSVEKEIAIDVPLAVTCMASGFAWPVAAWQDIVNGEMVVPDSEIYRGIH